MCQQVFLAIVIHRSITIGMSRTHFPRINVHAVLAFFGEHHCQSDKISLNPMTDIFTQFLLFSAVLVQSGHEISDLGCCVGQSWMEPLQ